MTQQVPAVTTERPSDSTTAPMPPPTGRPTDMTAPPAPSAAFPENGWHEAQGAPGQDPKNDDVRAAGTAPTAATPPADHGLLRDNSAFMERWTAVQTTFVDSPRQAVEQADTLVGDVIQELARVFAEERQQLEAAWSGGDSVSTEDLRQALQKYRDFFQALLHS
jgi:hypothetical protein